MDEMRGQIAGLTAKNAELTEQVKNERDMLILTVRNKEKELDL